ncbi:MAG: helix-turn-helix transcriptional regulator [Thermodesulfobacteriota bacterium]
MSSIQFIERDGHREYAIVPIDVFERLMESAEDREDIEDLRRFRETDDGFRIPGEIVFRELDGESPVKLWREHNGLTVEALAARAGISKAYLSQIENRKRTGTLKTMKAIADALAVPVDALTANL